MSTPPPPFGSEAPRLWKAGLPAIPLIFQEKRPVINDWSRFHDMMPTDAEMDAWIANFAPNNIGLALGKQSGLCMIDIDTDDQVLIKLIKDILPGGGSPWCRIGAKGMMLAFKFSGVPTFRIKDVSGKMIVEHLSTKTQIVLPPSIHPTTKRPYVENCPLVEVLDQLVPLPGDIEQRLRSALKAHGVNLSHSGWTKVTEYVSVGSRDVKMTSVAGFFANGVMRGELTVKGAIDRLRVWHSTCQETVAGDDVDIEKGIQNLIKFIRNDVVDKNKALPVGWNKDLTPEEQVGLGLEFTDDQEEWDYDRVRDHLRDAFEEFPAETKGRIDAISYALKKIGSAKTMGPMNRERLLKYINETSGTKVGLPTLREQMRDLNSDGLKGADHAEIAQAVIKELELIAPMAFYASRFMKWNGSHWEEKKRNEILRVIAEKFGHYPAARRSSDHNGIAAVMSTLLPLEICTQKVTGVNFSNGFVTPALKMVPHQPAFGMMYTLPYRYLPEEAARAHRFMDFLTRSWGKDFDFKDKVSGLQEAICATIFGLSPSFQRAFLFYGAAKTGKTQLLEVIQRLVPDSARSFCGPDRWSERFAPADMLGAVINVCGELSEKRLIGRAKFKAIGGGEEMSAENKNEKAFKFRPTCAHFFASNHLPKTEDTSPGFTRRWLVFQFSHPIGDHEKVADLGELIVAQEREAIAAWAISALPRLMAQGDYTRSSSHKLLLEEVANANNALRLFLTSSPLVAWSSTNSIREELLHRAFHNFALTHLLPAVKIRGFHALARQLAPEFGYTIEPHTYQNGTTEYIYKGIALTSAIRH